MKKNQLIEAIATKTNVSPETVTSVVTVMHELITGLLKTGDLVKIPGFGTFSSVKRDARKGRNPKTGATIDIPSKTLAKFKPSKELKEQLDA